MANKQQNVLVKMMGDFISKLTLGSDQMNPFLYKMVWFLITIAFLGLLIPAALGGFWDIIDSFSQFFTDGKESVKGVIDLILGVDFTTVSAESGD